MQHLRAEPSRDGGARRRGTLGGAARGAAGGALFGAIIGGGKGAGRGAALGAAVGGVRGNVASSRQRQGNYQYYYDQCMRGAL